MKGKKRVLVLATSRKTRGGITAVVIAHERGDQWKEYDCKWIETHIDRGNFLKSYFFIKAFMQFIFLVPFYDIIHIHVASYSSLKRKMYFFKIAKLYRKKVIAHFHPHKPEVIFEEKNKSLYRKLFNGSDRIVVLAPQWKKWLNEALGITKNVKVIFNPCPLVPKFTKNESKKYILFAGTIYKRKGYADLITAFSKIAIRCPGWYVILAGNGEIDKGKRLAKELGIEKQIEFPGWVTGIAKDTLFKNAGVYCLASSAEGFPMAVLEAWAYGVPVICTPVGGLVDIVKNEVNALVYNYGDIDGLAEQLERIICNNDLRLTIGEKSKELSLTLFAQHEINSQVGLLYEELLTNIY